MIWGNEWIYITTIAVIIDLIIGEFPCKHPVEYLGDAISGFEKIAYKDSIARGTILLIILILSITFFTITLQAVLFNISKYSALLKWTSVFILGVLASTGLASKSLKDYIKKVLFAPEEEKRANLSALVTRNTALLDDRMVYSSLIETHSENLSDGFIAPLFYLMLFGLPGIAVYKTVSTLDSMIGYKNDKYFNYGKASAILDDVLNFIPARITAFFIWMLSKSWVSWNNIRQEAKLYSSSPNAGYPVVAAAYNVGVKLGGTVFYGDNQINKAEIGPENIENYEKAAINFLKVHSTVDKIILISLLLLLIASFFRII